MKARINKALDYSKLLEQQAQGKLLKKHISFPLMAQTKYDGNYVVVEVLNGRTAYYTSGGLTYTHTDANTTFDYVVDGYYIAERIAGEGKLGDRVRCNLRGPKINQTSTNHSYKVFDYLTYEEYHNGVSIRPYTTRYISIISNGVPVDNVVTNETILNREQLDDYLKKVVNDGYEGLMLYSPDFIWRDTKSRTVDLVKYKKRRTADLLVVGTTEGEGKYEGMVGALLLQDSNGISVSVGSGLSDLDRSRSDWVGEVVEIEYEQILDTYIQPTFIQIRGDKNASDID